MLKKYIDTYIVIYPLSTYTIIKKLMHLNNILHIIKIFFSCAFSRDNRISCTVECQMLNKNNFWKGENFSIEILC